MILSLHEYFPLSKTCFSMSSSVSDADAVSDGRAAATTAGTSSAGSATENHSDFDTVPEQLEFRRSRQLGRLIMVGRLDRRTDTVLFDRIRRRRI